MAELGPLLCLSFRVLKSMHEKAMSMHTRGGTLSFPARVISPNHGKKMGCIDCPASADQLQTQWMLKITALEVPLLSHLEVG